MGTGIIIALLMFFLVLAVSAMILRAACGMVGETAPELGRAIMIVCGAMVAQVAAAFVLGFVGLNGKLIMTPVSAALTCWVYSQMLPTTMGRAFLIWLAQIVVVMILAFVASFAFAAVLGGAMMSR